MKDINLIPEGEYCYSIVDILHEEDGMPRIKTRMCPYYEFVNEELSRCNFHNVDSDEYFLLDDQVKYCNINLGDEEYEQE